MAYKVTLEVRSQVVLSDELIDQIFDAVTDSMPLALEAFDTDVMAKTGGTEIEIVHALEESVSIDAAAAWSLVAFRDAIRMVDSAYGVDTSQFVVEAQIVRKYDPEDYDDF